MGDTARGCIRYFTFSSNPNYFYRCSDGSYSGSGPLSEPLPVPSHRITGLPRGTWDLVVPHAAMEARHQINSYSPGQGDKSAIMNLDLLCMNKITNMNKELTISKQQLLLSLLKG